MGEDRIICGFYLPLILLEVFGVCLLFISIIHTPVVAFCFSGVLGLLFLAIVVKWSCGLSKKEKGSGKKNQKKIGKICLHF